MSPDDIERLRALALTYLDLATNGETGRDESDPIYQAITEHRDFGRGYSSCGDLCHWLLYRLGVRATWVNREEACGWKAGKNVGRLMFQCPVARPPRMGDVYEAGDILGIWNEPDGIDAHVFVVRYQQGAHIHSADLGQPGGQRRTRFLHSGELGGKKLQRVIRLDAVLRTERARLAAPEDAEAWAATILAPHHRPTLRYGCSGEPVRELQRLVGVVNINGIFGETTGATVRMFQKKHGLVVDGIVGPRTWAALLR